MSSVKSSPNPSNCCQATDTRAVFGDTVTVSGCWFHCGQALMNRLKKIGRTNAYRNEENTQEVFQCLLALPLLPVAVIDLALKDVTAMVTEDSPWKTQLEQLCRYVHEEWIRKKTTLSRRGCRYKTILGALTMQYIVLRCDDVLRSLISSECLRSLGHLHRTIEDSRADVT